MDSHDDDDDDNVIEAGPEPERVEIVMELSIRNGDAEPKRLPPVSVKVDRRTLSGSPVHVKIGVQGDFN